MPATRTPQARPGASKPRASAVAVEDDAARPLTADELSKLHGLLARAMATQGVHGPAVRLGEPYVALVNLSVPRRSNNYADPKAERAVDLVMRGETVYLTPEEASRFTRCDPDRDGRQIPVIRKLHGPDSRQELGFIPPQALSGRPWGPGAQARPDPRGSSFVQEYTPPESVPPVPAGGDGQPPPREVDAEDLPPTRQGPQQAEAPATPRDVARAAVEGVDRDLVNAVRARMPAGTQ